MVLSAPGRIGIRSKSRGLLGGHGCDCGQAMLGRARIWTYQFVLLCLDVEKKHFYDVTLSNTVMDNEIN